MKPETQIRLLESKIAYYRAKAAAAEEELAELPSQGDQGRGRWAAFDPSWKQGVRLSRKGEEDILRAYDDHLKQGQVAQLFRISPRAAHAWHKRWKQDRGL